MNPLWLMRMAKWARRPPSMAQVRFFLIILAICFVLAAVEAIWGWPEVLRTQGGGRMLRP